MGTWQDLDLGRPIAAPLEQCAELLGVDLATIGVATANIEPYVRADGAKVWSLMQLERQLRPEVYAGGEAATSTADESSPPPLASTTRGPSGEPTSPPHRARALLDEEPFACMLVVAVV